MKPVREILRSIRQTARSAHDLEPWSCNGLDEAALELLRTRKMELYQGKVREVVHAGSELLIVHTDRLTAFDRLIAQVPFKGLILAEISEYWLQKAAEVVPTHYLARPHGRVLRTRRTDPVKAEVVIRGYLAGSMLRAYEKGVREFCGTKLPDGLRPWCPLPAPVITPTTKAAAFEHDEDTSPDRLIAAGKVTAKEWQQIESMAHSLFAHGQKVLREKGWILVDTKYEFGRLPDGQIIVIDEVHTPDSSRFWRLDTYDERIRGGAVPDMLDKEIVRRKLLDLGFSGYGDVPDLPAAVLLDLADVYLDVAERLTGKPVMADDRPLSSVLDS